ncbi:MAG: ribonuclease J [Candidatus Vogelbacteria bacterium CG10_big_fil_rev_8_21_14_0_10_45_14]|uniref:Ribonuclease J n=1 Tax=Candidatus Vogelbacteria bacterium CG10_big_fil_rev_8_21_14_0_10_45_14 TaxID=1975042 RepID=A0A2H0RKI7_9BACT|nr:MAG: ribonuclease J [Candidatus Vogelbacteria bacterium CG10_big_fil_rev_8_21_14_0_10_45_14]
MNINNNRHSGDKSGIGRSAFGVRPRRNVQTGQNTRSNTRRRVAPSTGSTILPTRTRTLSGESNRSEMGMVVGNHGRGLRRFKKPSASASASAALIGEDVVRVIPLGGVEEVGKNMTIVEYKDDIIIVDLGFQFPDEDEAPGVDYIIPDISYLEKRKKKIRGVFITHGHLDHIGGIPYMIERLGNPTIYTRRLTAAIIQKRQTEFPHLPRLNLEIIDKQTVIKLGDIQAKLFKVTHTIPDAMGVSVITPQGNIVFTGDFKIDHKDGEMLSFEKEIYEELGRDNNLLLLADSTNAWKPGFSFPEKQVHENIEEILRNQKGRLIIGTFASLLERMIFIINMSEKLGKKVVIEGRSMRTNMEIAMELDLIRPETTTIISAKDIDNYPKDKVIILATGAQGDQYAALMRMSKGEHKQIKLEPTDTIILSSSIVPGNEKRVQKLKDNLSRHGCKVVHYLVFDIHSSGHGYREECKWTIEKIKPRYFMPVHGYHQFLREHADVAVSAGVPMENIIIPDNGTVVEFRDRGRKLLILKEKMGGDIVMVDGLGSGSVSDVVIRDRQQLAQDGMFVIIAVLDTKNGKVRQSPDIVSRGFVYLKESQEMLRGARYLVKKSIEESTRRMKPINMEYIRNNLREELGKYLMQKTQKRPIILPVLIEV